MRSEHIVMQTSSGHSSAKVEVEEEEAVEEVEEVGEVGEVEEEGVEEAGEQYSRKLYDFHMLHICCPF